MTRKLNETTNFEAYKRALRGDPQQSLGAWAAERWNALSARQKLGYAGAAVGLVAAAAAGIYTDVHNIGLENGAQQSAASNEYCSTTDLPNSYAVPTSVTHELLSKDATTQAAGWTALLHDMKVPQDGSFGEVTLTVTDDGSAVETDAAQLNGLLAAERQSDGTLGTVLPRPDAAATAPSVVVTDVSVCTPGYLS